jgi:hypothetical protein
VQRRAHHRILATVLAGLFTLPALAQFTRDASATAKIDEAVNTHYLMMELDKAENLLTGTVQACEDKCRPETKAKAWMYVGVVRGSGRNDQASAAEAFAQAKALDPNVKLDEALATPETKATFDATAGGAAAPVAAAPVAAAPVAAAARADVAGDMVCTPEASELQTRMPLPISCTTATSATTGVIKFQEYGSTEWKKMTMNKVGDYFQAEIPCTVTGTAGPFLFYVGVKDEAGEYVDQYGSKKEPAVITLSENAAGPAPSFPGGQPVARCAATTDCPPDFPGCASAAKECGSKEWGASCKASAECACGLACEEGTCVNAQTCKADSDCSSGSCVSGTCSAGDEEKPAAGPFKRHWLGVDVGVDLTTMGGASLCTPENGTAYGSYCYFADGTQYTGADVGINGTGFAMGQLRVKLGYDFALTQNMQIGARVGMGFVNTAPGPDSFFPVHGEARFTYNFSKLGNAGLRPAVFVGGGVAEVDGAVALGASADGTRAAMTIYKRAGIGMGVVGGSLGYAIAPNMAIKLDVNAMLLFGSYPFNFAVTPALGFVYGL